MNISIPGYTEDTPVQYSIQITIDNHSYNVKKRYSEFETFNSLIEEEMGERAPVDLPPKKWIGNKNREVLDDRRKKLEIYLRSMVKREDWRESLAFQQFLEIHKNVRKSPKGEWTKKITETKEFIQRASQANGGAEERKFVVMAGGKIKELENHLVGNQDLGDGEYRRRKDILQQLSRALLNVSKSSGASGAINEKGAAASTTTSSLFNTQQQSPRVLGGGGSETSRTRDVNNAGLLDLQKNDMAQQDEMLQMLRETVLRQKQLGEHINEEIIGQNKLLDELDADTHRMSSRINQAKKRASKFT